MRLNQLKDNLMRLGGWEAICNHCHAPAVGGMTFYIGQEGKDLFHDAGSYICGYITWRHIKTGKIFED